MKQIFVYECLWAKKVDLWTTCGLWPCSWIILDSFMKDCVIIFILTFKNLASYI